MLSEFTWYVQSSYVWTDGERTVAIDPWRIAPEVVADVIFVTHAHFDHYSPEDIDRLRRRDTAIVAPYDIARELNGNVTALAPGDTLHVAGIRAEAVPAYNRVEDRLDFHPRRNGWVGYLLELGPATYYHAGDTDHLPELDEVRADVAFLPIGGTYTMDPGEAAALARSIGPGLAVPMHYGFVVGSPSDATRFRTEASPVPVEELVPVHPLERD
jgi:L-ascorbate metabolism protein UlaG (beta-lactamase superfamily)